MNKLVASLLNLTRNIGVTGKWKMDDLQPLLHIYGCQYNMVYQRQYNECRTLIGHATHYLFCCI